jgi:hypothetical protein
LAVELLTARTQDGRGGSRALQDSRHPPTLEPKSATGAPVENWAS